MIIQLKIYIIEKSIKSQKIQEILKERKTETLKKNKKQKPQGSNYFTFTN